MSHVGTPPLVADDSEPVATATPPQEKSTAPSRRRKAISGSAWTAGGQVALNVLRLAGNLVVTRLVAPDVFGLAAVISVIMLGLELMSDVGLGPAIIQHRRGGERRFLNTAWTIQILRGLVMTLIACTAAWPLAWFYEEPSLRLLIPGAALTALIAGFNSTAMHTATRNLQLGRLTILQVTCQVVGIGVMVAWASISPTVWALIGGNIAICMTRAILSHLVLGEPRNRFAWDRDAARELLNFGKWIFLNSSLYFWATQGDRILLGKLTSFAQVGVYQIGFHLGQPIVTLNSQLSRSVFMPLLSETFRDRPADLSRSYYKARLYSDFLLLPALGAAMALAQPVVEFLYDSRYWAAAPILQIFLIHAALRCILEPAETCVLAIGIPGRLTVAHVGRTICILAGVPLGFTLGGLHGVAWAVVAAELPVLFFISRCLSIEGVYRFTREARAFVGVGVGYAIGYATSLGLAALAA